mmetsp:Transcript_7610/g.17486  ORF Transcript_7610/g.17486 Transcript_7610/m.17486 type:complete len:242 (-) Transcript_7610:162-887(-)
MSCGPTLRTTHFRLCHSARDLSITFTTMLGRGHTPGGCSTGFGAAGTGLGAAGMAAATAGAAGGTGFLSSSRRIDGGLGSGAGFAIAGIAKTTFVSSTLEWSTSSTGGGGAGAGFGFFFLGSLTSGSARFLFTRFHLVGPDPASEGNCSNADNFSGPKWSVVTINFQPSCVFSASRRSLSRRYTMNLPRVSQQVLFIFAWGRSFGHTTSYTLWACTRSLKKCSSITSIHFFANCREKSSMT